MSRRSDLDYHLCAPGWGRAESSRAAALPLLQQATVKRWSPFPLCAPVASQPSKAADVTEHAPSVRETEEGRQISGVEQSNGLGKPARELNGGISPRGDWPLPGPEEDRGARPTPRGPLAEGRGPPTGAQPHGRTLPEKRPTQGTAGGDLDFDLSSDSESEAQSSDGESGERRGLERPQGPRDAGRVAQRGGPAGLGGERPAGASPCGEPAPGEHPDAQEEDERDGLCGLGGGSADRKEAETESQNSEQSGITAGESLDQSVEEEEEEEDTDEDDHLVHLEEILARVHSDYYAKYDRYLRGDSPEPPDIRKIVPELKSRVLADVAIIFSGLHPTNFPIEKTREHYHATALGAKILTQLVLDPDDPDRATHLIAARAGTRPRPQCCPWGGPLCPWCRACLHWPCAAALRMGTSARLVGNFQKVVPAWLHVGACVRPHLLATATRPLWSGSSLWLGWPSGSGGHDGAQVACPGARCSG